MLRYLVFGALLLVASALRAAAPVKLDSLKVGATTYSNVTVIGANKTDLYFTHAGGIANVKLKNLPPELQEKFGYDPRVAAEAERKQGEDQKLYLNSLASNLVAQARQTARAAQPPPPSSEDSLADPVSDRSLLGKRAPAVEVEKWLSDRPALEGKFVLVSFWAPWSLPCRKYIPELNGLQKKFADKLVVVGLTAEPEAALEEMAAPKLEFASAIDTQARLSAAAGVTSVPFILLVDPRGVVRYQGHPGALDEKKLQALLAKPTD